MPLFPLSVVWTLPLGNALTAAPAYDATRAYFAIEGDRIVAYSMPEGTRLWIADIATTMDPVAGDDLLFVVTASAVTALRGVDGTVAWSSPLEEKLTQAPVWDNGWLVAATDAGEVLAVRARDGELIWRRTIGERAHAAPVLGADRVYIPVADRRVVALQVTTGAPLWERRLGGVPGELLALDDRLYFGADDHYFYSLDAADGRPRWRWRVGVDAVGRPIADDRAVYFTALDNVVRSLNQGSGSQRWKRALPLRPAWGPLEAGDTVLITGVAPVVRGVSAKDGKPAGELPALGEIAAPLHLAIVPRQPLPMVIVVTRDIAKGATVTALLRSFEPAIAPVAPLPNLITILPAGSPTATGPAAPSPTLFR
jgi:hypothetical protein